MKNNVLGLMLKDLRLLLHPSTFVFFLLAPAMLFIPSYPRPISYFYLIVSVMNMFTLAVQYKDHEFTGLLPVTKRETVLARVLSVCFTELALLIVTIPFAFLAARMFQKNGMVNAAGMEINVTLYALMLLGYAVANLILIPGGFRKHFKVIIRGLIAMASFMLVTLSLEGVISSVAPDSRLGFLNGTSGQDIIKQLPVLAAALVIYAVLNYIAYRTAYKSYENAEI